METSTLIVSPGSKFTDVSQEAIEIARTSGKIVEFEFNDIRCLVNAQTNPDFLWRDYKNAHLMKWESIGPNCVEKYSRTTMRAISARKYAQELKWAQEQKEYENKCAAQRENVEKAIDGVQLELSDADGWRKSREANSDGYGAAALDYAETWAKLMQVEIAKGNTVAQCYEYTQNDLGYFGITGFQFGCGRSILVQTWKYGAELNLTK